MSRDTDSSVIARENQDARCLHFSLSWLAHLRKAYPEFAQLESGMGGNDIAGSESDIVTFLQQKAVENKDWATLSSSLLTQAEATIESVRIFEDDPYTSRPATGQDT